MRPIIDWGRIWENRESSN